MVGGALGVVCWTGILILTCRRLFSPAVRRSGSLADIATDLMLLVVITLGNCLTLGYQLFVHEYNYWETVSVWVRQLPLLIPTRGRVGGPRAQPRRLAARPGGKLRLKARGRLEPSARSASAVAIAQLRDRPHEMRQPKRHRRSRL